MTPEILVLVAALALVPPYCKEDVWNSVEAFWGKDPVTLTEGQWRFSQQAVLNDCFRELNSYTPKELTMPLGLINAETALEKQFDKEFKKKNK